MTNNNHFGGVIWTNHALERLGQRGLSQELALQTFKNADIYYEGKNPGTTEFKKRFGTSTVTLIAKKNEKGQWVVLSNWIDPPLFGTEDYKKREEWKKYKKANFWGKLFYIFKKQLGF